MDSIFSLWNPSWNKMPWKVFSNPIERFQVLPSFVIGEFVFISLSILLFIHAHKQGRFHKIVWYLSFVTGFANDVIFMALPMVDNFWQAQACIMLTPRAPLYIPCVYNVFMYCGAVASWRFGLNIWAESALAGLLGEMIYSPYDITGIKFLWWTWHDTDAPVRHRLLGVPVGSSAWVITFTATFQFLIRRFILRPGANVKQGIFLNIALTTFLMMIQMSIFQLVSLDAQGLPTVRTLLAVIIVYVICVSVGLLMRKQKSHSEARELIPNPSSDWIPRLFLSIYYTFLVINMATSNPGSHVSTGVHQTVGPCDVTEIDFAGQERQVYLCAKNHTQDWTFDCPGSRSIRNVGGGVIEVGSLNVPKDFTEWYTICGNPHSNFPLWFLVVLFLAILGTTSYYIAFTQTNKMKGKKD